VRVRVTQGGFTATSFEAPAGEIPAIGPLPPGSYDLEVVTSSGELGGMQFEVQPGADVNLTVPLTAEAAVSGRILLEDDAGDLYPVAGVEIELIDRTRWGRAFRTRRTAVSAEDGGFRFEAVPGGQYRIAFDPPSGTHVRAGQNSGDLTVDGDEVSLAIMLGSPSATLIGSLHDAAGRPVYGGIVALVPEDRSLIRLFESTRTAADGAFRFEDLAPGDYALYAWRELPGAAYRNESFMEPYESMGRPVALTPGDNLRVEMEVLEQRP
jgi:hypothetical protein